MDISVGFVSFVSDLIITCHWRIRTPIKVFTLLVLVFNAATYQHVVSLRSLNLYSGGSSLATHPPHRGLEISKTIFEDRDLRGCEQRVVLYLEF